MIATPVEEGHAVGLWASVEDQTPCIEIRQWDRPVNETFVLDDDPIVLIAPRRLASPFYLPRYGDSVHVAEA